MAWFTNDRHWFVLAVVFYGLSMLYSIFLWRRGFRHHNRITYAVLGLAFVFHTVAMGKRGFTLARCPVNNLYEAMIFVNWTIVTAYLVLGIWSRLRFLGAFASPVLFGVGVFALMPSLDTPPAQGPQFAHGWASLHASLVLLSYGAFGLSSVAALMFLTQEHDLKFHKLRAVVSLLPPMQRLELTVSRLLEAGFILLTAGLVAGAYNLKQTGQVFVIGDAKVIWSLFVWCLYLTLLVLRWGFAHRGRRLAWGVVGSFAFVLMTFWGSNLLSGIHHP